MKKDVVKKAVVLGISLIFIFVAYMPAVCSQGGMGATVLCGVGDVNNRIDKNTRCRRQVMQRNKQCRVTNDDKKTCEPNQKGGVNRVVWKTRSR